jgi:NADH-quinone oxidoreductase subunit G
VLPPRLRVRVRPPRSAHAGPRRKLLNASTSDRASCSTRSACILCRRCVRFCKEITGDARARRIQSGRPVGHRHVPDEPLANDYSICTADICPVGALLSKDFHHKMRVWFLDETESICPNCANGLQHEGSARRAGSVSLPTATQRPRERQVMCDRPSRLSLRQRKSAARSGVGRGGTGWPSLLRLVQISSLLTSLTNSSILLSLNF